METLRHVRLDGYTLQTWDTQRSDRMGKTILRYEFKAPDGTVLFEGSDFACSPMICVDSDDCLRSLLGFLTLKPGDTDRDYFDNYTPAQMAFAEGPAESLSLWSMDDDDSEHPALEFENLDGFESEG